jgi:hypothetical protein
MRGAAYEAAHNAGLVKNADRSSEVDSDGMLRVDTAQITNNSGSGAADTNMSGETEKERRDKFHKDRAKSLKPRSPYEGPAVDDDIFEDTAPRAETESKFQSEIDMLKRTVNELVLRSQFGGALHHHTDHIDHIDHNAALQGQFHDFSY